MIKDLIYRLMEEATEEATHKGWCDTELATNEQTRKEKTLAIETLNAEIDSLVAEIAQLTDEIVELTAAVAELDAAMAKATKFRGEEKAKNAETIKDAQEAQTAAAEATAQKEYEVFMSDSEIDKSAKTTDIANKTTKKVDLEGTQKELDAALAYFDKLKPSCVDAAISYE